MLDIAQHDQTSLTISDARVFFEKKYGTSTSPNSRKNEGGPDSLRKTLWEKAYNKKISNGDAVVVPIDLKNGRWSIGDGNYLPFGDVNYLLMYKNSKNEILSEWVTLMPDLRWLHGDRSRYTGKIIVQTWEGENSKVYDFGIDGRIFELNAKRLENSKTQNQRTNINYTVCITVKNPANPNDPTHITSPANESVNGTGGGGGGMYSTYCHETTIEITDPWGGSNGTAGSGGLGSENGLLGNYYGSGGVGGGGPIGVDYVPQCNPNISPGTPVNNNQLPPCAGYQPLPEGIDFDSEVSAEPNLFFDDGGDPEALWWDVEGFDWQTQALPTYANFYNAYPKDPNDPTKDMLNSDVYNLIGGRLKQLFVNDPITYFNACAVRVSRGLNYSGVTIPYIASQTVSGADGKYYFTSASKLYNWMNRVFPSNQKVLNNRDGGRGGWSFNDKIKPDKGIYIMRPNFPGDPMPAKNGRPARPGFQASGHCSLYNGNDCLSNHCYFNADGGVNMITLWILN